MIGTGAEFSGLPIFHKGKELNVHRPIIAGIIFFSLIIFLISVIGMFIVKNPPHNACVLAYGLLIFFLGFIPMVAQGGALMAVAKVDSKTLSDMCKLSMQEAKNENKFVRGLLRFAHEYDLKTEHILDQTMCTETCPCYNYAEYSYNSEGVPSVLSGAYYEYTLLSLQAYNHHKRIFDK